MTLTSHFSSLISLIISYLKIPHLIFKNIIWRFPQKKSSISCVFIMGVSKSGTTLVQKIIESNQEFFPINVSHELK